MVELILDGIFSVPYFVIGIIITAMFDISIHYTKATTRFTFVEILGCTMFWPLAVLLFLVAFFKQEN
jgi:hypothetical protein